MKKTFLACVLVLAAALQGHADVKAIKFTASTTTAIIPAPRDAAFKDLTGTCTLAASTDVVKTTGLFISPYDKGQVFAAVQDLSVDALSDWHYITDVWTKITPANVQTNDVFTVSVNGTSVSFKATAGSVANVTAGLTAAINNDAYAKTILSASDATTYVKISHIVPPQSLSASAVDGGGANTQTIALQGHLTLDRAYAGSTGTGKAYLVGLPASAQYVALLNTSSQQARYKLVYGKRIPSTIDGAFASQNMSIVDVDAITGVMVWTEAGTADMEITFLGKGFANP